MTKPGTGSGQDDIAKAGSGSRARPGRWRPARVNRGWRERRPGTRVRSPSVSQEAGSWGWLRKAACHSPSSWYAARRAPDTPWLVPGLEDENGGCMASPVSGFNGKRDKQEPEAAEEERGRRGEVVTIEAEAAEDEREAGDPEAGKREAGELDGIARGSSASGAWRRKRKLEARRARRELLHVASEAFP